VYVISQFSISSITMATRSTRQIAKTFLANVRPEGQGARVRRSIGTPSAKNFTPFLMLDHLVSTGGGFPDHPHRGQETITYVLKGNVDHEDFTGSKGTIKPGDLQFMTAGRGIVHAEMPRKDEQGRDPEIMQLWVDLPKHLKNCEPRYRDLMAKEVPVARPSEEVEIKVISGESYGVKSLQDLAYTPVVFYDYHLKPDAKATQSVPDDFNVFLYILNGSVKINGQDVPEHHCVLFDDQGNLVNIEADEEARLILVGGKRLQQPVVQFGPFVETSQERIMSAFEDYQTGQNGFERSIGWSSEIGNRA
jgi:redox-sensitive bicupin YhaK (pirin superfamily)